MGIFSYDSPIMKFLSKLTDLVVLNLLTIVFCIPIITSGAAITAAHYVALKIRRDEGYVWKNFWKSFKENLKQSTAIWVIWVIYIVVSVYALLILINMSGTVATVMQGIITGVLILSAVVYMWLFPVQSKFTNSIKGTITNAFILAFRHLLRTLGMIVASLLPIAFILLLSVKWYSILLLFGCSVPTYLCAMAYDKVFEKLEDMILEKQNETENEEAVEE